MTYIRDGSSSEKAPAASDNAPPSGIKSARDVPAAPLAEGSAASEDKSARKVLAGGVNVNVDVNDLARSRDEVRQAAGSPPSLFFSMKYMHRRAVDSGQVG